MTAGLAMTVSYASVVIIILILAACVSIMATESRMEEQNQGTVSELEEGIAFLTVVADKSRGRARGLKGMSYSLSEEEVLGSGRKADTLIRHPAVEKLHVSLSYRKPGKVLVKPVKNAKVSTSRKAGELMDGDRLILGEGDNRIELQLSFLNNADIEAARRDADEWDDPFRNMSPRKKRRG